MIVVNTSPTLTHLPWKKGKARGEVSFYPGNNNVDPEIFEAVLKTAGEEDWKHHYGNFLVPVGKPTETTETVSLDDLTAKDFVELVDGTTDVAKLEEYRSFEASGSQRKTVLAAIDDQLEKIAEIEKKKAEA
ncbi:hypothetical protein DSCW_18220 [Desulfosarcina widdelii]|uniref:Uncharacterized protein n=1 Tax=Desulfosarcina widdelii TaxID=947919 RepID=A0A5K7Z130_9BACT|nr:hypothetical protein [Desulfosarcina widdelii]BBO74405.1 hypothetical protein DSCW_18220 [Desulfosarcina widdelii]